MKCRINIKGQKIWVDDNNSQSTRPLTTDIVLYRDSQEYKSVTLNTMGDGRYSFLCLPVWKDSSQQYIYRVDEPIVPAGYTKTVDGYNVINLLENITITIVKTWNDQNNIEGQRPDSITVHLLQNGVEITDANIPSPPDTEDTTTFTLGDFPYADANSIPFVYSITEDPVEFYNTIINGFHITNSLGVFPFSFSKNNIRTGMSLQDAQFDLLQNGIVQATATSDALGLVTFNASSAGLYQLQESQPPAGYMDNTTVYQVQVNTDGTVMINGVLSSQFCVENSPTEYDVTLIRASESIEAYSIAPNSWPLHGTGDANLCMVDKIMIQSNEATPILVKWDYGIHDALYFLTHGTDITSSYQNGIPIDKNDAYTVYLAFENGYEAVLVITIDNLRNGSSLLPYLLLDFETASDLESLVPGIGQFNLDYMQGGGVKQTQYYELYENISMENKEWIPLGGESAELFTGGLNGNNHEINGLSISYPEGKWYPTGLFSRVGNGAIIENLDLINCEFVNTTGYTAGIAGYVGNHDGQTTILRNLYLFGSVQTNSYGAGIAANVNITNGVLIIDGCSVKGSIDANNSGGILGTCLINNVGAEIAITNCYTNGLVKGAGIVGGIAGNISSYGESNMRIEDSINCAEIQSTAISGGIIACASSAAGGLISSCCNRGTIYGVTHVGGIAGDLTCSDSLDTMSVVNCYNSGTIITNTVSSSLSGGIVGLCHTFIRVLKSYNIGTLSASGGTQDIVGGITGNYGRLENCASIGASCSSPQISLARISASTISMDESILYNNIAFEGMAVLINGVQKSPLDNTSTGTDGLDQTAVTIKTQGLYQNTLDWDFDDIWEFGNGGYMLPILRNIPLNLQPDVLPAHLN